jgi:20S proteasome alpha/beta subunit
MGGNGKGEGRVAMAVAGAAGDGSRWLELLEMQAARGNVRGGRRAPNPRHFGVSSGKPGRGSRARYCPRPYPFS